MITALIIVACIVLYVVIGAYVGQKLENAHDCGDEYCEYMGQFFGGVFWPIGLPIAAGIALANKQPKHITTLRKIEEMEREAGLR